MFGFIKRKLKEFTESFSEEAHEESIEATEAGELIEGAIEAEPEAHSDVAEISEAERVDGAARKVETGDHQAETREAIDVDESPRDVEPSTTRVEAERNTGDATSKRDTPLDHQDGVRSEEPEVADAKPDGADRTSEPSRESPAKPAVEKPKRVAAETSSDRVARSEEALEDTRTAQPAQQPEKEPVDTPPAKASGFGKLLGAFTKRSLNDEQFERIFTDLEIGMLEANTAYDAVQAVKENLKEKLTGERVSRFSAAHDVSRALLESIAELFEEPEDLITLADEHEPLVIMLIGINGSGKTTTAAKLARAYQKAGKKPVLAAADTFRAAAIQQLEAHAKALDCRIIKHDYGADPAAVAYDAVTHAKSGKADVVLIDTAGRLHSNENLLKELEKIKRVIKPHRVIFVGESIAGNDLLEQAETFNERIGIDGIILTKTDVDESGGGMLSVSHVTRKPINYLGGGQGYDDLTPFSIGEMARLLGLE